MTSIEVIQEQQLAQILRDGTPLVDVRAEVEFQRGCVPGSINLPLLNSPEREQVGICYKQHGQDAAIALGQQLVSGLTRDLRVQRWAEFFQNNPGAALFCARGGLRSKISAQWLSEYFGDNGQQIEVRRIAGGYKVIRQFYLDVLQRQCCVEGHIHSAGRSFIGLSGFTGSGKTELLHMLQDRGQAIVDLEALARHRGSAFGAQAELQPAQATFENHLADQLHKLSYLGATPILLEDESRGIGNLTLPSNFFAALSTCPLIILSTALEERVLRIVSEYVEAAWRDLFRSDPETATVQLEQVLLDNLAKIFRRLGDERYRQIKKEISATFLTQGNSSKINSSAHAPWVELLLKYYYDPLYDFHLAKNKERIVFVGNRSEIGQFVSSSTERHRLRA